MALFRPKAVRPIEESQIIAPLPLVQNTGATGAGASHGTIPNNL